MNYTALKLEKQLSEKLKVISGILAKGKDVELRKTTGDCLKVIEVTKVIK